MRPLWIVAGLAITLILAAVLLRDEAPGTTPIDPAEAERGAILFQANCATCHGVDATGTDSGPALIDPIYSPRRHADEAFQRAVLVGVPAHHWTFGDMPPIAGLDRAEVAAIVAFVRSLQIDAGIYQP